MLLNELTYIVEDQSAYFDYRPETKLQDGINQYVKWFKGYYDFEVHHPHPTLEGE